MLCIFAKAKQGVRTVNSAFTFSRYRMRAMVGRASYRCFAFAGFIALFCGALLLGAAPAQAQSADCAPATSPGDAPPAWQTYCWLDFSTYNDTTARSAGGQTFSFLLSDGSSLQFTVNTTTTTANGADDRPAPSWTGAAVGNSSFLGIPGRPILYMVNSGATVNFTFSSINIVPPPGVATVTDFAFVVADAESTDNSEYLNFTTNGGSWEILDIVPPISGSQYPVLTGTGTSALGMAGGGQTGRVGAYIAASNKPTTVTAEMKGQGLQGMMFAIRFASITLTKEIGGARVDPADQFTFEIQSTSSGSALASGTSTGTGNGPFDAAVISTASGIDVSLVETMAAGSVSDLSAYDARLTCINNATGSSTVLPTNLATTDYDFGSLDFGDAVECTFTNTAFPHISLEKQLSAEGRINDTDEFRIRIRQASGNLRAQTTSGAGATIVNGNTGMREAIAGDPYRVDELARGTTDLSRYTAALTCTNAFAGSTTTLPTAQNEIFTPQLGDVITCVILNTRDPASAILTVSKRSELISDPVTGTADPYHLPFAVMRYFIDVENRGDAPVDVDTITILDVMPQDVSFDGSAPVVFTEGATASGLDAFDPATMVTFSSQPAGIAPYDHSVASGYDTAVRGILIEPEGILAASDGVNHPSFTISFLARIE